ncbi:MAG: phosphodiester glycosidase family protein [Clostridia bacterium]|nr:phosphodiester glycosidase family protein [Clostridia bacterium]
MGIYWKKLAALFLAAILMVSCAAAEGALPLGGPAPYKPLPGAYSEDHRIYDDGTIRVEITVDEAWDTKVYYARVKLTDPSQLRTALAAKYPSKQARPVSVMAEENNAVFAINGDFFSYHRSGIVVRSGVYLRESPVSSRDTLIIDKNGDFKILTNTNRKTWEAVRDTAVEAFCFGPGLIVDGEVVKFNIPDKVSCGARTEAQRLCICQMGPLDYLIIATEGPEQEKTDGLTIAQLTELAAQAGAQQCYNLDGGSSVTLMMGGVKINAVESKNRYVGDIIYFATLNSGEEAAE